MGDLIKNINDPNFKSLTAKLVDANWVSFVNETPKTLHNNREFEFHWTEIGQMCRIVIKNNYTPSPIWCVASDFLLSLNEQEEAFFHENMLSDVPIDQRLSSETPPPTT